MKVIAKAVLAVALTASACTASAFDLGEVGRLAGSLGVGQQKEQSSGVQALGLLGSLDDLGVTPQQALGGVGVLLSLAQSQLPASEYSALGQSVPGIERFEGANALSQLNQLDALSGLLGGKQKSIGVSPDVQDALGNVTNLSEAQNAFNLLGMDSGLIAQFAPLLLQYLGSNGAGSSLMGNLAQAWGVPAQ